MRRSCLLLLLVAVGCKKEPPSAPVQGGYEPQVPPDLRQQVIPQDEGRMKQVRAERLARLRAAGVEAYQKVGKRNPKWDDAATDALEKLAVAKAVDDRDGDAVEAAYAALGKAVALGCDDPYVRYAYTRYRHLIDKTATDEQVKADFVAVATALRDSAYPPIRRARAAHDLILLGTPPTTAEGAGDLVKSQNFSLVIQQLLAALKADPHGVAPEYVELSQLIQTFCGGVPGGRQRVHEAFARALPADPKYTALAGWLAGQYLLDQAWAVRGKGSGIEITADRLQAFQDGLAAAGEAFDQAWALDPTQAQVAVGRLLTVGPTGHAGRIEEWFVRAMTVDPDCFPAAAAKGTFLLPRWGGVAGVVREFADRLAETRNWHGMLPFEAIPLLTGLESNGVRDELAPQDWEEVDRVFQLFLHDRPDSKWGWSMYALQGAKAKKNSVVLKAAEHLKGGASRLIFKPGEFEALVAKAKAGAE